MHVCSWHTRLIILTWIWEKYDNDWFDLALMPRFCFKKWIIGFHEIGKFLSANALEHCWRIYGARAQNGARHSLMSQTSVSVLWWVCVCVQYTVMGLCVCAVYCDGYVCVYSQLWWVCVCVQYIVMDLCVCTVYCDGFVCVYSILWWVCVCVQYIVMGLCVCTVYWNIRLRRHCVWFTVATNNTASETFLHKLLTGSLLLAD